MAEIELTKGYVTIIDDEDYSSHMNYNWWAQDAHPVHTYACRWEPRVKPRRVIRMHHSVIGVCAAELRERNLIVDHIDRNGLNNKKENLRVASKSVNAFNSERSDKALGIYFDNQRLRYKCFMLQPTRVFIGTYKSLDEALKAQREFVCG